MLQNAYFLAKIGADTVENEQHFAEILPIGRRVAAPRRRPGQADRQSEAFQEIFLDARPPAARARVLDRVAKFFNFSKNI